MAGGAGGVVGGGGMTGKGFFFVFLVSSADP